MDGGEGARGPSDVTYDVILPLGWAGSIFFS